MFGTLREFKFDTIKEVRVKNALQRLGDSWLTSVGNIQRIEGFQIKWTDGKLQELAICRYFEKRSLIIAAQPILDAYKGDVFATEHIREIKTQELFSKSRITIRNSNEVNESEKEGRTVASVLIENDFDELGKYEWKLFDLETLHTVPDILQILQQCFTK